MASNFRILRCKKGKTLHLNLLGDFDATSAHELLNALKQDAAKGKRILIATDGLRIVYPFGREMFRKNLHTLRCRPGSLVFEGRNMEQLEPTLQASC